MQFAVGVARLVTSRKSVEASQVLNASLSQLKGSLSTISKKVARSRHQIALVRTTPCTRLHVRLPEQEHPKNIPIVSNLAQTKVKFQIHVSNKGEKLFFFSQLLDAR